jgi:hypothetical protein
MTTLDEDLQDQIRAASDHQQLLIAETAVAAAADDKKKEVVEAAAGALSDTQRMELAKSWMPSESVHRLYIYLAAFVSIVILALGLGALAWGAADSGNAGVGSALATAAVSLPSAIIGGLLGAYVQR